MTETAIVDDRAVWLAACERSGRGGAVTGATILDDWAVGLAACERTAGEAR